MNRLGWKRSSIVIKPRLSELSPHSH